MNSPVRKRVAEISSSCSRSSSSAVRLLEAPPSKVIAIDGPLSVTRWRIGGAFGGVVGRGCGVFIGGDATAGDTPIVGDGTTVEVGEGVAVGRITERAVG